MAKTQRQTPLGYMNFTQAILVSQRGFWPKNGQHCLKNDPKFEKRAPEGPDLGKFVDVLGQKTLRQTPLGYSNFTQAIILPQRGFLAQKRPKMTEKGPEIREKGPRGSGFG